MSKVSTYSAAGAKKEQPTALNKAVFGVEPSAELIKLAYNRYLAGSRGSNAVALRRGEVRGGGRKPWRQKGTGRARVGSIRVPNWRGGGVIFGPTGEENYKLSMPAKMRRAAIRGALSLKATKGAISVIESFKSAEGKTKPTEQLLAKLGASGRVLLVVATKEALISRATRNLPQLKAVAATYLNVYDIMNADLILITAEALAPIDAWLDGPQAPATPAKEKEAASV